MRRWFPLLLLTAAACGAPAATGPTLEEHLARTPPPAGASTAVAEMFLQLDTMIANAIVQNADNLPRNPASAHLYTAKNAMMRQAGFATGISANAQYAEGGATARNGRHIPIVAIFAQSQMRDEATAAVRYVEQAFTVFESFLATDYPHSRIWIWYGFVIGATGGSGQLFMEDRTSYEARTPSTRLLPFEAVLGHEHAHSYVSTEALTQFLEVYLYNVIHGGSTSLDAWSFTRGYQPFSADNIDCAALLDIYQLVGVATMAEGYRAVLPLRPPYGSPLTEDVKQAFAAVVPEALRPQVMQKLSAIRF